MYEEITRMDSTKMLIPYYYVKYTEDGRVISCRADDNPKSKWALCIDSYKDLVNIIINKSQVNSLIGILNHHSVRDNKLVSDLRKALLCHSGRDIFEGDPE